MHAKPASPSLIDVARATVKSFFADQCARRAAALSYFSIFALPPSLLLVVTLAGLLWSPESIQRALELHLAGLIGPEGASEVRQLIVSGQQTGHGVMRTIISVVGLVIGATGAFLSLQEALNVVWRVGPEPRRGRVVRFMSKRLLSLGMVGGVAILLTVFLLLTTGISALGTALGGAAAAVVQIINIVLSIAVLSVLFAAMLKFLPNTKVTWRLALLGGVVTAIFFEIGNFVIGVYLAHSNPGNAFGAAGAFALILVWIYYACLLVLFGAEFTQHYAADVEGSSLSTNADAKSEHR